MDASSLLRMMQVATSGLSAQRQELEVIAHNIANLNSVGFKANRATFQEVLGESIAPELIKPSGMGVNLAAIQTSFVQGVLEAMDNPLSLAIEGEGFFRLERPDGSTAYTRDGTFHLDEKGQIVSSQGFRLIPPVTVPADAEALHINPDGRILVQMAGKAELQELGRLSLSRFPNPEGLEDVGQGLYVPTVASGKVQDGTPGTSGLGEVMGGAQEQSNVDLTEELVKMALAQRAYSLCGRSLQLLDEMLAEFTQHL